MSGTDRLAKTETQLLKINFETMQKHCKVKAAYLKYLYETQYVSE